MSLFSRFLLLPLLIIASNLEGEDLKSKAGTHLAPFFKEDKSLLEGFQNAFITSFISPAPFAHPVFKKEKSKHKSAQGSECTVSRYVARFVHKQNAPLTHKILKAVDGHCNAPLFLDVRSPPGLSQETSCELPSPTKLVRNSRDSPPPLSPLSRFAPPPSSQTQSEKRRQTSPPSSPTQKSTNRNEQSPLFVQTRRGPLDLSRSATNLSQRSDVRPLKTSPSCDNLTVNASPPASSRDNAMRSRSRSFSGERRVDRPNSLPLSPRKRALSMGHAQPGEHFSYSTLRSPEESLSCAPPKKPRVIGRFDSSRRKPFTQPSPTALKVARVPPERLSVAENLPSGSESSVRSGGGGPRLTGERRFRATVRAVVMARRWAQSARESVARRKAAAGS
jgi:hypothetical protein